jgi:hypothetical protein
MQDAVLLSAATVREKNLVTMTATEQTVLQSKIGAAKFRFLSYKTQTPAPPEKG